MLVRALQLCQWEDEGWQGFFERHAITPLIVRYEEFAESPKTTVRQITAPFGLEPPERLPAETWQHRPTPDARPVSHTLARRFGEADSSPA
jgi:LPS sulfotransferase NodH